MRYHWLFVLIFLAIGLSLTWFVSRQLTNPALAGSVSVTATVNSVCGNGVKDFDEQCDGSDLGGQSCSSLGFSGGTLSCNTNCTFNTSQCTSGGGGGGGGGGGYYVPPTAVNFSGRAYPQSTVTILKDAQIAATTVADSNANFQVSVSGLSGGNYIFGVYSEDNQGRRSSLLTFPVSVVSGSTVTIGGIFIAPTIAVDKSEVKRGENLAIFGQSVARADITIVISSDEEFFNKITADKDGTYLYNFDTAQLDMGQHFTKSKAALSGAISSFSKAISFTVGTKTVLAQPSGKCSGKADLNGDCRVNLVDFSIAAYWYKRPLSADFKVKEAERLSGDGKVDLVDFSIMAYYWTG